MKVIVVPDGYSITTVDDEGERCKGCVFEAVEVDDAPWLVCLLDHRTKLPCIDTIYAVLEDVD